MTRPTNPAMDEVLLPCPFCGSDPVMSDPHGAFSRLAAVYCPFCEIKGPLASGAELAAAAWNTRAALAPDLQQENARLRGLLMKALPYVESADRDSARKLLPDIRAALGDRP